MFGDGHQEKLWLENFQGSEILFCGGYVDDTCCLSHSEHDAILFFDYVNSRHPNISFSMEKEAHHKLPFLDVLVDNNDPYSLLTRDYSKKTFTGLLNNYFSFIFSYKVGLIRTLVDRAYKINNSWLGLHEDITKLMDISVICDLLLNRRMATWNLFADHILRNYGERI